MKIIESNSTTRKQSSKKLTMNVKEQSSAEKQQTL